MMSLLLSDEDFFRQPNVMCVCKYHKCVLRVNEDYNLMHPEYAVMIFDSSGLTCPGITLEVLQRAVDGDPEAKAEMEKCSNSWEWVVNPTKEELREYQLVLEDEVVSGASGRRELEHYLAWMEGGELTEQVTERVRRLVGSKRTEELDKVLEELSGSEIGRCERELIVLSLEGPKGMERFIRQCYAGEDWECKKCNLVALARRLSRRPE